MTAAEKHKDQSGGKKECVTVVANWPGYAQWSCC